MDAKECQQRHPKRGFGNITNRCKEEEVQGNVEHAVQISSYVGRRIFYSRQFAVNSIYYRFQDDEKAGQEIMILPNAVNGNQATKAKDQGDVNGGEPSVF